MDGPWHLRTWCRSLFQWVGSRPMMKPTFGSTGDFSLENRLIWELEREIRLESKADFSQTHAIGRAQLSSLGRLPTPIIHVWRFRLRQSLPVTGWNPVSRVRRVPYILIVDSNWDPFEEDRNIPLGPSVISRARNQRCHTKRTTPFFRSAHGHAPLDNVVIWESCTTMIQIHW